jgi:nucleoside-diphosphate-sugar epimerase
MSRYIVTGGAGFIGSALVRALIREPDSEVVVLDNLLTGKMENLEEVLARVRFHNLDINDYDAVAPLVAGADVVFHMAAIPSVPRSIHEPVASHAANVDGTFQLLRACVDGKARRVVYAASSSAYGDTEALPKTESMRPRPLSPYAAQKLMGEHYCAAFSYCHGIETVALRFFNIYGPRQDPSSPYSGVISVFMRCLLERRSPTIYGDGEQSRDFTYVEDVVELCRKAARVPGVSGNVYNGGNGGRYTLNRTWALLQAIEGVSIPAVHGPPRPGDVRHSQADTTAAMHDLGHAPLYSFEQGLRRTLDWYRASFRTEAAGNAASPGPPGDPPR